MGEENTRMMMMIEEEEEKLRTQTEAGKDSLLFNSISVVVEPRISCLSTWNTKFWDQNSGSRPSSCFVCLEHHSVPSFLHCLFLSLSLFPLLLQLCCYILWMCSILWLFSFFFLLSSKAKRQVKEGIKRRKELELMRNNRQGKRLYTWSMKEVPKRRVGGE